MARRRFQRGTVMMRGKHIKVWVGRWREDELMPDGSIRRRRRAEVLGTVGDYPTKRLALRALESKLVDVNSVDYKPTLNIHFREFAAKWQDSVLINHEPSTQSATKSVIRTALMPAFGAFALKDITTEKVQRFVSGSALAPKTIKNQLAILRMLWTTAKAWGYVTHDPFDGIVTPKATDPEQGCFSIEDMRKIVETAGEPWRTMFWLASETGMRVGELTAVRWEDLDLGTCRVHVKQSVWCGQFKTTKSRKPRTCVISKLLATQLESMRQDSGLVFPTTTGKPIDQANLRKSLYAICDKVEIPRRGMHAFRHGNETVMAHLQAPPKLRQQRLGHSDERMMLRYEHVITQDEVNLASQLGSLLVGRA